MLVLDNFYYTPNRIIDLTKGKYPLIGCGDGNRSLPLDQINKDIYLKFCDKIYSAHNTSSKGLSLTTYFTEHISKDIDIFNKRWVHIDGRNPNVCRATVDRYRLVVCGQIFLTPDPDPEAGVKICELKKQLEWSKETLFDNCLNDYLIPKDKYNAGLISLEEYTKLHDDYHKHFDITCTIENKFNRMVSWKAGTLHGEPMTKKMQKRLTQYFFVEKLRSI